MAAKIYRINYKSDFILTLESDAGWMTPFCIKFWTSAPSQAYFIGWDGETYTHCTYDPSEPTKLQVQFDDHHLTIGNLKFQVAYHFTVADFPDNTEDEVINPANITTEIDGETYQVMLDFTGETAPEIEFSLPAYANEAQRIANEQQRISNEEQRIADEQTRIGNEETRINQEQTRQDNEAQRIRNEQTRINQEEARVREFATMKHDAQEATTAANDAAALANQKAQLAADKAQLAADKAALAQDASNLANQKAQLAADKAALAQDAAYLANQKAQLAQQKAEYAQSQGDYAKQQGDYAKEQGDYAKRKGDDAAAQMQQQAQAFSEAQAARQTVYEQAEGTESGSVAGDGSRWGTFKTNEAARDAKVDAKVADITNLQEAVAEGAVYDISANNSGATYADLTAALGPSGANVPEGIRRGGMSIKYVHTSDNNYVQSRYMGTSTADADFTNVANWQGEDEAPTLGSKNLVESGGVFACLEDINLEIDGVKDVAKPLVWSDGYVNGVGKITASSGDMFCQPIELKLGETIEYNTDESFKCGVVRVNSLDPVSVGSIVGDDIIIRYNTAGVVGTTVKYTAEENMYIIISLSKTNYSLFFRIYNEDNIKDNVKYITDNVATIGKNSKIYTGSFLGEGTALIDNNIALISGRSYRLVLDDPSYSRNNTGTDTTQYIFFVSSYNGSSGTVLFGITRGNDTGTLNKFYDFTVPLNSDYIKIGCRANESVEVLFNIYDVTEILNITEDVADNTAIINSLTLNLASVIFKDNCYAGSNGVIVTNDDWYIGTPVAVNQGDTIKYNTGSDLLSSSPQKALILDVNLNPVGYYSIWDNRETTFSGEGKYIALSTRKMDGNMFAISVNGAEKYRGLIYTDINISLINKRIDDIDEHVFPTSISTKNEDKLDLLRASSNNGRRLQILIATDAHEDWKALQNAVDFANQCSYIDALLLSGDNCGQAVPSLEAFEHYNQIVNTCTKPVLSVPGNHDAGYDRRLRYTATNDKIYQYITQPTIQSLASGEYEVGKSYFFHDFTSKKTRMICLNEFDEDIQLVSNENWQAIEYNASYDSFALNTEYAVNDCVNFGLYTTNSFKCLVAHTSSADNEIRTTEYRGYRFIGETQMNWLVSTMLSTPADYSLVICTHVPASNDFSTMYRNNKFCSKYLSDNTLFNAFDSDVLGKLVDDFNKGLASSILVKGKGTFTYLNTQTIDGQSCAYKLQYDFSQKNTGVKFLVFCCGHTHADMIMKNSLGSYSISPTFTTATTRQYAENDCPRSSDDTNIARDALTAIAFDYDHDGVILTRVGTTSTTDGYLRDVDRLDLTQ